MVEILFTVYDLDGTVSISPSSDIVDKIFFSPQLEAVQFRNSSFTPVMTYMGKYSLLDLSFRLICGEDQGHSVYSVWTLTTQVGTIHVTGVARKCVWKDTKIVLPTALSVFLLRIVVSACEYAVVNSGLCACLCVCAYVCACMCVWVGNEKGIRSEEGWSASLVRPAPLISMRFHLSCDH